ncbi:GTP 3',8-cyclase MoaA [Acetobacteraceae bacterium KSS8]|uniref:GTP 3',8-cyclase n=1 Tax=Endosaccharibacter trunci TaxID=2812733 RepID=A0ABT1WAX3_9PROT|nr:GTP 3',8-cyclase MoaA [Acetobacteraceae bacterium KSS8]
MNPAPTHDERPEDRLGRRMHDLRISVMDRCNFRCTYCMPVETYGEAYRFLRREERLDFAEIERICRQAASLGVEKLRLTGGEPLLRPDLAVLVGMLRGIDGIRDIALTTNGVLLPEQADTLRAAGLDRVTVSLDALDEVVFARLSGGHGSVRQVLRGIDAALAAGLPTKINMVVQRGINDSEVLPLLERFRFTPVSVRFIEFMDVGNRNKWNIDAVVPSRELRDRVAARWPVSPLPARYGGEVASRFRFDDGAGEIGFISSVSDPFCGGCTRARLSSEGKLYTCLFATEGTDLRRVLRDEAANDEALREMLRSVWLRRGDRYSEERALVPAHGDVQPKIEMHYIGG